MQPAHPIRNHPSTADVQPANNNEVPPAWFLQLVTSWPAEILASPPAKAVIGALIAHGLSMSSGIGLGVAAVGLTSLLASTALSSIIYIGDDLLKWHVAVAAGTALGGALFYGVFAD